MTGPERRALVVALPMAVGGRTSGASLRLADVTSTLKEAGFAVTVVTEPAQASGRFEVGVAVSYVSARHLSALRSRAPVLWLDAMDSWLTVNGSGLSRGRLSYLARAGRDAVRLAAMPHPDLVTWISDADRRADGPTVRGRLRLVLPGRTEPAALLPWTGPPRAVLVGDWAYPPNRDGLRWFRSRVIPRLAPLLTGVDWRCDVYGAGAPVEPAHPRLHVHGYVDDEADMHREGDVHVAPIRFGAGVKRKVLRPVLAGLPVVGTTAAVHGLRAHPLLDRHDRPEAFAAALAHRLRSPQPPTPPDPAAVLDRDDRAQVLAWLRQAAD